MRLCCSEFNNIIIIIIIIIIIYFFNNNNNNKSYTSIIAERSYNSLDNDLLPAEQKGYRGGSYGCKDQLLINKATLEEATSKRKNLSTAWIDYKKAFNSVPHSWIKKCHEIYRIYPTTIKFVTESMKLWKATLILQHAAGTLKSRPIKIRNGIFQGIQYHHYFSVML